MDFNIARIQTGALSKSMVFLITSIKSCRFFWFISRFRYHWTSAICLRVVSLFACYFANSHQILNVLNVLEILDFYLSGFWVMEFVADRILVVSSRPKSSCSRRNSEIPNAKQIKKVRQDVHSKPSISDLNPGDIEIHLTLRVLNIFYWIFFVKFRLDFTRSENAKSGEFSGSRRNTFQ